MFPLSRWLWIMLRFMRSHAQYSPSQTWKLKLYMNRLCWCAKDSIIIYPLVRMKLALLSCTHPCERYNDWKIRCPRILWPIFHIFIQQGPNEITAIWCKYSSLSAWIWTKCFCLSLTRNPLIRRRLALNQPEKTTAHDDEIIHTIQQVMIQIC